MTVILVCTMGSVNPWWRFSTMQLPAKPRNMKLVADLINRTQTRILRDHLRKGFSLHLLTINSPPLRNFIAKDFNPSRLWWKDLSKIPMSRCLSRKPEVRSVPDIYSSDTQLNLVILNLKLDYGTSHFILTWMV